MPEGMCLSQVAGITWLYAVLVAVSHVGRDIVTRRKEDGNASITAVRGWTLTLPYHLSQDYNSLSFTLESGSR